MKTLKTVDLFYQEGSSNKEYHLQLVEENGGHLVQFQFGRVGNALQTGTKTNSPVSLEEAEKIYNKILKEKLGKGYAEKEGSKKNEFSIVNEANKKEVVILPQLLNAIDEVESYINNDSYLAQEKKDGVRKMVITVKNETKGYNKKGTETALPDNIIDSIRKIIITKGEKISISHPTVTSIIIDGELVGDILHVFDILSLHNESLKELRCENRNTVLNSISFGPGIKIVPTAFTTEEKRNMYNKLKSENAEGIVFKKKSSSYKVGRPASLGDQLKFKFQKSGTFIVANHTKGKRSVGLEVVDGDKRVSVGKVTIPPNKEIPEVGAVVEVQFLYAYKDGCLFQPVYLTDRSEECDLTDCGISQLVYKAE